MITLPENLFLNPVLTALRTTHAHLALSMGEAVRYPASVAPFAAIATPTERALRDLHSLLVPDAYVWVTALGEADAAAAQLQLETSIDVLQMVLPSDVDLPPANTGIVSLACSNAAEMVHLTDLAFPGFFRARTCEMGTYLGIRDAATQSLIAMVGERLAFPGFVEISGLCTHPDHRGQNYAASLLWHLAERHRSQGIVSWLHVTATNTTAVNLYLKLGFQSVRSLALHKLRLVGE